MLSLVCRARAEYSNMLEKQTGVDQRGDRFWGANYTYSRKRTVEDADSRFMKFRVLLFYVFCFPFLLVGMNYYHESLFL